jgi:hypothetical protein
VTYLDAQGIAHAGTHAELMSEPGYAAAVLR